MREALFIDRTLHDSVLNLISNKLIQGVSTPTNLMRREGLSERMRDDK